MNPQLLKDINCCLLIPTYNNEKTVKRVIDGVLEYTEDIIIVNDGATDGTSEILKEYEERLTVIHFPKNQGKGMALRVGFKKALELGFDNVITIDSDGQHLPEDIPVFVQTFKDNPNSLIVGARNMDQNGIPKKSSFGHKFSNFWFRVETGTNLPDTQSGYRLYPVRIMPKRYFTKKFEFEIEVIVRSAWKNINVISSPCKVIYNDERVSHFRPFADFTRISILNTVLFTLAFIFRPILMIRNFSWKNVGNFFKKHFLNPEEKKSVKAASIGFGFFMGVIPLWGFQLLIGIPTAHFLRLNKAIFIAAANISLPPFIPVIVYLSFLTGATVLGEKLNIPFSWNITLEQAQTGVLQYLVGSICLALLLGVGSFILAYALMSLSPKKSNG